jgi:hypothetical protein
MSRKQQLAVAFVATCALLAVPSAVAKEFKPGDLRVCGRDRCVAITNARVLRTLSAFYYGSGSVSLAPSIRRGSAGLELRFRNGYVSGMVAGPKLDRFRAYGFYCGRFERGKWYRFPARAARAIRTLGARLRPLRVTAPPPSC